MQEIVDFAREMPDWFGKALVGAVGGALGWFANLIVSSRLGAKDRRDAEAARVADLRAARRDRLIELRTLLRQTRSSFESQARLRDELLRKLEVRIPADRMKPREGYESYFVRMAPQFNQDEKELHAIIRSITISSLRQGNLALLDWIARDKYFGLEHPEELALIGLAACIEQLQAHLQLWIDKYDAWIERNPNHSLVYLGDEKGARERVPKRDRHPR
jgi:hypothetical protein